MSKVYRFHKANNFQAIDDLNILQKRKIRKPQEVCLVAADTSSITDFNGTFPINEYRNLKKGHHITLTRMEADLIALANPGARPPRAIEDDHPWLPTIVFVDNSRVNFRTLQSLMRRFGNRLITARSFCDQKWNNICNSVRTKNHLDARFYAAWHLPIQETYILEESRPDRSVIALDFNSMYPACMQQRFPKPSTLREVEYNRVLNSNEDLPTGLFRCILRHPTSDFIRKHNPFRSFFIGKHLRATLSENVEVDLNEFEVNFFRRHYESIYIYDAIIADETMPHPLAREVKRAFSRRKHYQSHGNKALADREKFLMTLMSSCSQRPRRLRQKFTSRETMLSFLQNNYGISRHVGEPESASDLWFDGRKGITVTTVRNSISIDAPNLQDGSACFLLNQRIVAQGRVLLLELMEKVLMLIPDVEICYANIDSIQFSLPEKMISKALTALNTEISEDLGAIKIESISRHGLWLEPGRYWLYSDKVEKYRNQGIRRHYLEFKDHAVYVKNQRIGDLHIPTKAKICMKTTMSNTRSVAGINSSKILRQTLLEIGEQTPFMEVLEQLEENRIHSVPRKIQAFENLKKKLENPRPAASGRGIEAIKI